MAQRIRSRTEINRWHEGFQQVRNDWLEWLGAKANYYPTAEAAWVAFKTQQQKNRGWSLQETVVADSISFE